MDRHRVPTNVMLLPSPNLEAALPPLPPLHPATRSKLPLDRKLSAPLHPPNLWPLSLPPTSALPPAGTGVWGKNPRHGQRAKCTLCQNMNSTIDVRTLRVKTLLGLALKKICLLNLPTANFGTF